MQAEIPTITVHQLKQMIAQGDSDYVPVDGRNPEKYTNAHIPGSTQILLPRD
jgi:rhodanese-related sulfurtransferase